MTVGRYNVTEGHHGPSEHEQATCILASKSDKLILENEISYSTASFNILPLWVIIVNCNWLTWASTTCSTFNKTSAMLCRVWTPQRTGNETEGIPQVQERKAPSNKSTKMKGQQDRRVRTCTMVIYDHAHADNSFWHAYFIHKEHGLYNGWHGFRTEVQFAVMHCSLPLTDYFEFLHLHCLC